MNRQHSDFASFFDSIDVPARPAGAPSPFDDPFAYGGLKGAGADPLGALTAWEENAPAPPPEPILDDGAPGFYLIDDCGGRFAIDREFGVITLSDESVLEREAGSIWAARVRVIEQSGERYEQTFRLKLTGRVPQLAGAEEEEGPLAAPKPAPAAPVAPAVGWTRYAASLHAAKSPAPPAAETAPFGALAPADAPGASADAASLEFAVSPPAPATEAAWSALALH